MKRCYRCGQERQETNFYRHPGMTSGRLNKCKSCCKLEAKAYGRAWRKTENAAQSKKRTEEWSRIKRRDARLNPEERAALAAIRHHETVRRNYERVGRWKEANPDRWLDHQRRAQVRRYARKQGAAGHATTDQISARWSYYGNRCWMCGESAVETDHVIPLTRGGSDWPANQRPACRSCNARKSNRPLSEIGA